MYSYEGIVKRSFLFMGLLSVGQRDEHALQVRLGAGLGREVFRGGQVLHLHDVARAVTRGLAQESPEFAVGDAAVVRAGEQAAARGEHAEGEGGEAPRSRRRR